MTRISLLEAESAFADLVERARLGETIEITDGEKAIAQLGPAATPMSRRKPIDFERLRAFTDSLTPDPEPVEIWIEKFRDDARY